MREIWHQLRHLLTWCISSEELLEKVLYSFIMERTWQLTLTVMLWTLCHLFFSSFWAILVSSVLMIQALFSRSCRLSQVLYCEERMSSFCSSFSMLMGLDWRMHIHSQSVISFRSSIHLWTESTWIRCMLKGREGEGRMR